MRANFTSRAARASILALVAIACAGADGNRAEVPSSAAVPADPGWPRQYSDESGKLVVYQPQIDSWKDFRRLEGRFAVALTPTKSGGPVFGVIRIEAATVVDTESRAVALANTTLSDVRYPTAKDQSETETLKGLATKLFPKYRPPSPWIGTRLHGHESGKTPANSGLARSADHSRQHAARCSAHY